MQMFTKGEIEMASKYSASLTIREIKLKLEMAQQLEHSLLFQKI